VFDPSEPFRFLQGDDGCIPCLAVMTAGENTNRDISPLLINELVTYLIWGGLTTGSVYLLLSPILSRIMIGPGKLDISMNLETFL